MEARKRHAQAHAAEAWRELSSRIRDSGAGETDEHVLEPQNPGSSTRSCWLPRMTAAVEAKHSSSEAPNRVTAALSDRPWALVRQPVVACSIEVHGWEEVGWENGAMQGRRADWEGTLQPKLMLLFHDHRTELCQIHAGPPNPAIEKRHMGD